MPGPVVMIHGAFAGGWCFERFGEHLETAGWTTSAPDLPGHGAAADRDALAGLGLRDYADALAGEIAALAQPPVLLGHSMGGLLAQLLAARGLARGLILLAPAAPWGILPSSREEVAAAMGLMSHGDFWNRTVTPAFEFAAANALNGLPPARQRTLFDRLGPESGRALFEMVFWMFDVTAASHVNAVHIDCPVLCIAGGRDRTVAGATVRRIAEKYAATATLEEFAELGHMLLMEDGWQGPADACLEWLAQTLPSSA